MIIHYSFGSITIRGRQYASDLKIINGQVVPDWWRKFGHTVDVDDVADILNAGPDCVVIGSGGSGLMKVGNRLLKEAADRGIEIIVEPTASAIKTFNRLYGDGKKVAGGFHLTC